jgi:hypothetical protein
MRNCVDSWPAAIPRSALPFAEPRDRGADADDGDIDAVALIIVEGLLLCALALFIGSAFDSMLESLAVCFSLLPAIATFTAHLALNRYKTGYEIATVVGACVGLLIYLIIALVPSALYGAATGVGAATLLGLQIDTSLIPSTVVALGMLIGLLATSGAFVLGGEVVGRTLYSLVQNSALTAVFRWS